MIKCLIVDDEPLAVELIAKHLEEYADIEVAGKCHNIKTAVKVLQQLQVDLLFLDVQLPDMDGVSFLASLKNPPAVIFTTAHRKYAVQAFDLGVVDYLLKPVSFLRFSKAIDKFRQMFKPGIIFDKQDNQSEAPIVIKEGVEFFKILPSEILYIQGSKDYINIVTAGKKYMVRDTLKSIMTSLPCNDFMQIHRSYIIPVKNVTSFFTKYVKLNNVKIPIGPSYIALVKQKFGL